jgi:hypothetical protein
MAPGAEVGSPGRGVTVSGVVVLVVGSPGCVVGIGRSWVFRDWLELPEALIF